MHQNFDNLQKVKTPQIIDELNSSMIIFEISGLHYFSLKNPKEHEISKKPSYVRSLYMIFVLVIYTSLMAIYIFTDENFSEHKVTAKTVLTYTIQHSMKIGLFLVIFSSVLQSFFSTKKLVTIFENLRKIFQITSDDFKVTQNLLKIKKRFKINVTLMVLFLASTQIFLFVMESKSIENFLLLCCGTLPIIFVLLTVFKFVFYVQMINHELKMLRNLVEGIFQVQSPKVINRLDLHLVSVKPQIFYDDVFKKFVSAKKIYNILYDNGCLLNESMGFTMLVLLIVLVITLTASGYQIFVILVGGNENRTIAGNKVGRESLYPLDLFKKGMLCSNFIF